MFPHLHPPTDGQYRTYLHVTLKWNRTEFSVFIISLHAIIIRFHLFNDIFYVFLAISNIKTFFFFVSSFISFDVFQFPCRNFMLSLFVGGAVFVVSPFTAIHLSNTPCSIPIIFHLLLVCCQAAACWTQNQPPTPPHQRTIFINSP